MAYADEPVTDFNMKDGDLILFNEDTGWLDDFISEDIVNVEYEPNIFTELQPVASTLDPTQDIDMLTLDIQDVISPAVLVEDVHQPLLELSRIPSATLNTGNSLPLDEVRQEALAESLVCGDYQVEQLEAVAPVQVFNQVKKPKKRGRKPKSETGAAPRQRRRQQKVKVYDLPPLKDEESEKKRMNAVNAKKHRMFAKQKLSKFEETLANIMKERDQLKGEMETLLQRQDIMKEQLQLKQQGGIIMVASTSSG